MMCHGLTQQMGRDQPQGSSCNSNSWYYLVDGWGTSYQLLFTIEWVYKKEHFKVGLTGSETFNDSGKVHGNWPACPMIPLVCPSSPKVS